MSDSEGRSTTYFIPALGKLYAALDPFMMPLLRVVTGLFLVPHGAQKLFGWFGGGGIEGTAQFFSKMGLEPAVPLVMLVGATEVFGGLLIAVGLLTRPAAVAATILLLVAALDIHWSNGFFVTKGGFEFALFWAAATAVFAVKGGGCCSLDAKIGREF